MKLFLFHSLLQDEELDLSHVEIDETLVIEDDDISDDDHEDVCYLIFSNWLYLRLIYY